MIKIIITVKVSLEMKNKSLFLFFKKNFDLVYVKFGLFNELLGQLQIGPYIKVCYSLYFIRKIA